MMPVIRGGDWKSLVPIAKELLEKPELDKIKLKNYDDYLGIFTFNYKGFDIQVRASNLRIADKAGLDAKDLLVVRDKRVGKLKRKLKRLWKEARA